MPSYSGTVSSSQGVRTIDVTPNDIVTFTPTAATYTVEYPIGTVAISAATSTGTITANAAATQMRILCVSGSVAYANVDKNDGTPLAPTESAAVRALVSGAGTYVNTDGVLYGLSEVTPYVNATGSAGATVFSGPCELAGWYCSVAAGNITIYDALSATGTPIVPATALVAGPMPIFGAGTNGKLRLTTGCHVVLSGAATVRVLVA